MKRLTRRLAMIGFLLVASAAFAGNPNCDYNSDGACDQADLDIMLGAQGTQAGDAGFVAAADHDGDGVISLADAVIFAELRDD